MNLNKLMRPPQEKKDEIINIKGDLDFQNEIPQVKQSEWSF